VAHANSLIEIQSGLQTKGEKNPIVFGPMHWVFGFNAQNPMFANKTMVIFQLLPYAF
jgi:hypothetical protein